MNGLLKTTDLITLNHIQMLGNNMKNIDTNCPWCGAKLEDDSGLIHCIRCKSSSNRTYD